jgi:hypothetical protein
MPLSPDQAAQNLREIDQTGRRSASAYGYAHASPFFILWGIVWFIGYGGTGFLHGSQPAYLWATADLAGILGSFWIGHRMAPKTDRTCNSRFRYRFIGTILVIALFIACVNLVMAPISDDQQGALPALLVALFYGLMGIWKGPRFLVAGIVIAALTLGGFYYLHDYFFTWMAVVGGAALILAGVWLRTV